MAIANSITELIGKTPLLVLLLALADAVMRSISSEVKRTGTTRPFSVPASSLGTESRLLDSSTTTALRLPPMLSRRRAVP
jgi:hypothetical protein